MTSQVLYRHSVALDTFAITLPDLFDVDNDDHCFVAQEAYKRSSDEVLHERYPGAEIVFDLAFAKTQDEIDNNKAEYPSLLLEVDGAPVDRQVAWDLDQEIYRNIFGTFIWDEVCSAFDMDSLRGNDDEDVDEFGDPQ